MIIHLGRVFTYPGFILYIVSIQDQTYDIHLSRPSIHSPHTHTHTQLFNVLWSGTTRVSQYQKKHLPLTSILIIGHLLSSSSIYSDPWHPLCSVYELDSPFSTTSPQDLFGLPLALGPCTSYTMHFISFKQAIHLSCIHLGRF